MVQAVFGRATKAAEDNKYGFDGSTPSSSIHGSPLPRRVSDVTVNDRRSFVVTTSPPQPDMHLIGSDSGAETPGELFITIHDEKVLGKDETPAAENANEVILVEGKEEEEEREEKVVKMIEGDDDLPIIGVEGSNDEEREEFSSATLDISDPDVITIENDALGSPSIKEREDDQHDNSPISNSQIPHSESTNYESAEQCLPSAELVQENNNNTEMVQTLATTDKGYFFAILRKVI